MKKFEQELDQLKQRILEMGGVAESMVGWATSALIDPDRDIIQKVLDTEPILDRFQLDVDSEVVRLITIYSPIAKDLRFLLMVARINSDLERIGDQALNNCEFIQSLSSPSRRPIRDLSGMSAITRGMLNDALQAFADEDLDRAQTVLAADDEVDRLNNETFRDLLLTARERPDTVDQAMTIALVARSIERIADHATNICEEVIYLVKGEDIRHQGAAPAAARAGDEPADETN
jgi:phosphate transport system protein